MCTLTAAIGGGLAGYRALSSIEDHQKNAALERYKEEEAQQKLSYDQQHENDGVIAAGDETLQNVGNLREDMASSGVTEDGTVARLEQQEKENGEGEQQEAINQSYQKMADDRDGILQDRAKEQSDIAHMWQSGAKGLEKVVGSDGGASGKASLFYQSVTPQKEIKKDDSHSNASSWASQMGQQYDQHMGITSSKGRSDMPYNHPYLNYAHQKYEGRKPPFSPVAASIYDDYTPTRYSKSGVRSDFDMPSF